MTILYTPTAADAVVTADLSRAKLELWAASRPHLARPTTERASGPRQNDFPYRSLAGLAIERLRVAELRANKAQPAAPVLTAQEALLGAVSAARQAAYGAALRAVYAELLRLRRATAVELRAIPVGALVPAGAFTLRGEILAPPATATPQPTAPTATPAPSAATTTQLTAAQEAPQRAIQAQPAVQPKTTTEVLAMGLGDIVSGVGKGIVGAASAGLAAITEIARTGVLTQQLPLDVFGSGSLINLAFPGAAGAAGGGAMTRASPLAAGMGTLFRPAGLTPARPARVVVFPNPDTGAPTFFGHLGSPILFSRDLQAARRVQRLAARASRATRRTITVRRVTRRAAPRRK